MTSLTPHPLKNMHSYVSFYVFNFFSFCQTLTLKLTFNTMKKQKISTDSASTSTSTKKEDQINKISLKRQIEKPSENTPKKAKRSPLKEIKLGETMMYVSVFHT